MTTINKATQETLRRLVEQIERLESDKRDLSEDIRDKYLEARSQGFDVKILRHVIKLRKVDKADRDEAQMILETYMNALGMLADLPLGQAAIERATKVRKIAKAHGIPQDIADQVAAEG